MYEETVNNNNNNKEQVVAQDMNNNHTSKRAHFRQVSGPIRLMRQLNELRRQEQNEDHEENGEMQKVEADKENNKLKGGHSRSISLTSEQPNCSGLLSTTPHPAFCRQHLEPSRVAQDSQQNAPLELRDTGDRPTGDLVASRRDTIERSSAPDLLELPSHLTPSERAMNDLETCDNESQTDILKLRQTGAVLRQLSDQFKNSSQHTRQPDILIMRLLAYMFG